MSKPNAYLDVNAAWRGQTLAPITMVQSTKLFRKLVMKFGGRHMLSRIPYYYRDGRRVWASPQILVASSSLHDINRGLGRMVHDCSHFVFERLHPTFKTHSAAHAELEQEMITHVIEQGWHLPKPVKPKPTASELQRQELQRVLELQQKWETKQKRAHTALTKLRLKRRRLERLVAPN